MKNQNKKGFTLVELVIVIAVIAILSAILIPTFSGVIENANKSKAQSEVKNAITNYISSGEAAEVEERTTEVYSFIYVHGDYVLSYSAADGVKVVEDKKPTDYPGESYTEVTDFHANIKAYAPSAS